MPDENLSGVQPSEKPRLCGMKVDTFDTLYESQDVGEPIQWDYELYKYTNTEHRCHSQDRPERVSNLRLISSSIPVSLYWLKRIRNGLDC